jgi:hypothetical protein
MREARVARKKTRQAIQFIASQAEEQEFFMKGEGRETSVRRLKCSADSFF